MLRCLIAAAVGSLALVAACSARPQSAQSPPAQPQAASPPMPVPPPDQRPPELREPLARQDVETQVDALVKQGDFKALDALAAHARSGDQRTPAGIPVLDLIYGEADSQIAAAEHETRCASPLAAQVAAWAKADPTSPTAINLNAGALLSRAWCYRGGQSGEKVPRRDWAPFEHHAQAARDWLEAHKAVGQADGQWYVEMETVARAQGWSDDDFLALVRAGSDRYPTYLPIYQSGMIYFSPRWYGDNAKMDAFARMAADRTAATEGKGLYARLYWHAFDQLWLDNLKTQSNVDWGLLQQAMDDLTRRHPDAWNSFGMARLACYAGDHELMMRYFRQVFPHLEGYGDPNAPDSVRCNGITMVRAPAGADTDNCDRCKGR